ncbi:MAG: GNAT family N-acetyltransferase [Corallococcus sp.]|nr:GNAT family N-acetyltransferase [Bacillota bacterium]MCM1533683.1 GNAT family N-acetyltransferase [Corallococcus sp.]
MTNDFAKRIERAKRDGKFIQTERLYLLPLCVSDAPQAFKWCGDSEVNEFLRYSVYSDVDDVAKWIEDSGYKCFGFFLRKDGQLIGSGSVEELNSGTGVYEMGYNLAKAYWNKGYCTEASKAMLAYAVSQGISEFSCQHAISNVRSGRVIQKCGFVNPEESSYTKFDGTKTFKSYVYRLHIDSVEMSVDGEWFDKIVNGGKTVELRLNDGKRRALKIGDYIILDNLDTASDLVKCVARVTALHIFDSFDDLYKNFDMSKCGYRKDDLPNPDDMLRYYSAERQAENGVVGIEFELICAM